MVMDGMRKRGFTQTEEEYEKYGMEGDWADKGRGGRKREIWSG